jgi:choline-sulfatase
VLEKKLKSWPDGLPNEAVQALRQDYSNHLELLDDQVGKLLKGLNERSDASHTAISVCSDHGELLGDWGLLLKSCFLEGAIRSLFIHRPPGGRRGLRRLWGSDQRAYGLTESLWAAKDAVGSPNRGSFGDHLRQMPLEVTVAYADEQRTLR